MGTLDGKVAFITGAARGQGRSHAIGLAREGASILALDICDQIESVDYPMSTKDDLAETVRLVEKEGGHAVPFVGDVRDLAAVRSAVEMCVERLGRLDIVLANAGILTSLGDHAEDDDIFYDAVNVLLVGVWHTIRATAPVLIDQGDGGSIVITSSTSGLSGGFTSKEAGTAGYAAGKHGVVGLMRVYANILASHRIRVNTIHPCGVNTPMVVNELFSTYVEDYPEVMAALQNPLPVSLIEPEDVTNAVLWLVSESARYVTGITLPVDAGFLNKP